ncbi:alpha/beta fold hydrolase [Geomicrobium sp. JCM 19039]|uniref:alpha/beta fold hydrolase n=1 Tax=Geomicrobium sp. JCM 19039 TaxID=1460636 RepID=UPI0006945B69|nr:alpha/beta hydrolase [Geomicrobium sp. JCM 19039]
MNEGNRYVLSEEDVNAKFYPCEAGDSEKLFVLIHGFMSWSFSFQSLIPTLVNHAHVLTLDLPGFGRSKKDVKYEFSYEQFTKTVQDMIDRREEHFTDIVPIGHSMGGQIALRLARSNRFVHRVVLLASSGDMQKSSKRLRWASRLPFFDVWLARYVRDRDVSHVLKQVIHDNKKVTTEQIDAYSLPLQENLMYRALSKFIRQREGDLSREELHKITEPVLLLWGENDRIVPVGVGRYLEKELHRAKLKVFPKVGHLLPEEIPSEVGEEIIRFSAGKERSE